jgi:hypothetical protein
MRQSFEKLAITGIAVYLASLLMVLIIVFNHPLTNGDAPFRKPLIGTVFNATCLAGVFAAVSPETCSRIFSRKTENPFFFRKRIRGHHPVCEAFSTHVVKIGGRTLCAACAGLFLGGVSAIVFSTAYFFSELNLEKNPQLVLMGILMVALVLLGQAAKGFTRMFLNVLFPVGGMLVLTGVDNLFESLFLDFFILSLTVFWILVRIMVSLWSHWKTCFSCRSYCTAEN